MTLDEYLKARGAGAAVALAKAIGARPSDITHWRAPDKPTGRRVPAPRCQAIESATGGWVTCEELRPDINWTMLREETRRAAEEA